MTDKTLTLEFQSTLPARGATARKELFEQHMMISIHAPCTGSDEWVHIAQTLLHNFNPRSLHGERLATPVETALSAAISIHAPCTGSDSMDTKLPMASQFQSTLPARGATS